ncbi:MAG: DUF3426 domain-containing protein [Pseudomonadota bacterium]
MIVTCENCSSRFVVDPQVLMPSGRRVRCARCKHIWFQTPQPSRADTAPGSLPPNDTERRQIFQPQTTSAAAAKSVFDDSPAAAKDAAEADPSTLDEPPPVSPSGEDDDADLKALYSNDLGTGDDAGGSGDIETGNAARTDDDTAMPDISLDGPSRRRKKTQVPAVYKKRSKLVAAAGWVAILAIVLSGLGTAIFARETIAAKLPAVKPVYAAIGLAIEPQLITANAGQFLSIETPPQKPAYWRDDQLIQEINGAIINTATAPVRVPPLEGILRDRDNNELFRWLFSAEIDILQPGQKISFATEIVDMPQDAAEMELVFTNGKQSGQAKAMTGAKMSALDLPSTGR